MNEAARRAPDPTDASHRWASVRAPGVLRLTGPDHRAALQRVVSQDVAAIPPGATAWSLLLAPKGQFRALMMVLGGPEELLLLTPAGRREELAGALASYLRFSRSALEVVDTTPSAVEAIGSAAVRALGGLGLPGPDRWSRNGDLLLVGRGMRGAEGALAVATRRGALVPVTDLLGASRQVDGEVLERARVEAGFPAWGAELTGSVLPPETGIESVAISYSKGCYVGQETIARLRTYGRANRHLVRVRALGALAARPELPLPLTAEGEEKPRALLTTIVDTPEGTIGLALVRRELDQPGTVLVAGDLRFALAG